MGCLKLTYSHEEKSTFLKVWKNTETTSQKVGRYDYGARMYDPSLGRWHVPDPAAEKSFSKTPFHYCSNNPISRFDPDGRDDYYYNKGNWQIKRNDNKYHTLTINGGLQWRSDKLYVGALDRIHLENTVTFMMAPQNKGMYNDCLLYTSDAADE